MPYTPTSWTNGTTPLNSTNMSHLETQFGQAMTSLNADLIPTGFVLSGLVASKDATTATQLDVTSGVAYIIQTDSNNDLGRIAKTSSTQTTVSTNATYNLYLQPDGTWYWSTSNSPQANSIPVATVTTDGSGNIKTVTDARTTTTGLFNSGTLAPTVASLQVAATQTPSLAGTVVGGAITFGAGGLISSSSDTSANFSGTTAYISLPATGLPTGTAAWTIEAVVKIAGNPGALATIAEFGTVATGTLAWIFVDTSGKANISMDGTGGITAGSALSLNTPHHIVGSFDGTLTHLYVDGTSQGTATPTSPNVGSTGAAIGALLSGTASDFFTSQIQAVAIYSGALSSARVTAHNTALIAGGYYAAVAADSPLRFYRLNEPAGSFHAGCSIASTLTPVGTDGASTINRVASVGGQTAVGQFGASPIVAQALDVHVTATTLQTILTYTPNVTGLYRLSGAFNINNGTNGQKPIFEFNATSHGVTNTRFFVGDLVTGLTGSNIYNNSYYSVLPAVVHLDAGQTLTVYYMDNANTPNDYVSVIVERLA